MDRSRSASEAFISTTYAQKHKDDVHVSVSDLPQIRPDFKADKTCVLCGFVFGAVLNIVHGKRYCCSFCYRGVCAKCSPYTLQHPETEQNERCCNSCYNTFVTQEIRSTMEEELKMQREQVEDLQKKLDEEKQAEAREATEIEELETNRRELEARGDAQMLENEQRIKQLIQEEAKLKNKLENLKFEKTAKFQNEQRMREQITLNEQEISDLRRKQQEDQKKIAVFLKNKAVVDEDITIIRKQLQDSLTPQSEEYSDKSKRVVELQQGLALERELLVKLQHENLTLTQRVAEAKVNGKQQKGLEQEQELKEIQSASMPAEELKVKITTLRAENKRLEAELYEMKNMTPADDTEMQELKAAVACEKEENKKLMLLFQEQLLTKSGGPEPMVRDRCDCCAF